MLKFSIIFFRKKDSFKERDTSVFKTTKNMTKHIWIVCKQLGNRKKPQSYKPSNTILSGICCRGIK